jgi:phosphohistidine phosphatase
LELILWRHCDAAPGAPDDARPLTPRGRDEAARIARWLGPRLPADCRIVVSPALRAQQTASALARPFDTDAKLAPGASVSDVLRAAGWPDAQATTLLVGHEPTLGGVAGYLLHGIGAERALDKGAVVWLATVAGDDSHVSSKAEVTPYTVS